MTCIAMCGGAQHWRTGLIGRALDEYQPDYLILPYTGRFTKTVIREAQKRGIHGEVWHPDWERFKRQAGPIANSNIVKYGEIDRVVALEGGKASPTLISAAMGAGIPVDFYPID